MYPNAAQDSATAKILLFSNANSTTARENGSIRYSCDDGATWSAGKQFKSGYMAYSTATALSDGNFGLLYEGDNNNIHFAKFNASWLGVFCGASVTAAPLTGANGATVNAELTVSNDSGSALTNAVATFAPKVGWAFGSVEIPAIANGESKTVSVPVTIPAFLRAGTTNLTATISVNNAAIQTIVPTTVTGGATENIVGLQISGSVTDTKRDLATKPYTVGEAVPYQFRVDSLSNVTAAAVPTSGNFKPLIPTDGAGNCRYRELPVGGGYNCATPKHIVTADELAQGFFVPVSTWTVSATGATTVNYTIEGVEVDLIARQPQLSATAEILWNDVDGNALAGAGDTVTTTVTAANSGNVPLTGVAGLGGDPVTVAVGDSVSFSQTRELTTAEIAAGAIAAHSVTVAAANGAKDATAVASLAAVTLPVAPAVPEEPAFEPSVERANLKGQAPVDLGLKDGKYSVGELVSLKGVPANEWAYVHLNQHGARIGWFLADAEGTLTFTVPEGTKNGKDTVVVSDMNGEFLSFGTFHVTPAS
ncbi:NEW3 domain-containing protein [Arthrobacter psychrolactophilus]